MNSLESLVKKYKNVCFESSCYNTPEFLKLAASLKRALKKDIQKSNFILLNASAGHFYISGFITHKNGIYIYFSIGDVRWDITGKRWYDDILYRTAKDEKDYHGGANHYCKLGELFEKADMLAEQEKVYFKRMAIASNG